MDNRLEARFRLSVYATLMMATLSLGHAEEAFLPGILLFVALVGVVQLLAYTVEGRWVLDSFGANVLGLIIAVVYVLWITFEISQPTNEFFKSTSWPEVAVPYIGPILMATMLGMFFCRKTNRTFWGLHIIGFSEVGLACVLASEPLFGLLFIGYVVCAVWSLMLFYLYRHQALVGEADAQSPPVPPPWRPCRWAAAVTVFSFVLFLATPQFGELHWDPFRLSQVKVLETGFANSIDLNRTGQLKFSNDTAFEVLAQHADGSPKLDLSQQQRWRGVVLDRYDRGQWYGQPPMPDPLREKYPANKGRQPQGSSGLPRLGPNQYFLSFDVDVQRVFGLFLAEPVTSANGRPPIVSLHQRGVEPWQFQWKDWTLAPQPLPLISRIHYKQVLLPVERDGLSPPLAPGQILGIDYLHQPLPRVRAWTAELLQRLEARGRLRSDDFHLYHFTALVSAERRSTVAAALCDYLASSREFTYSIDLRRKDRSVDPNEDFLLNVKEGHCERYASALALMLRSCNIPARVVVGFHGVESEGDGRYVVRENCAHSWVEALVQKAADDGTVRQHWLTLDPTPLGDFTGTEETSWLAEWWSTLNGERLWRKFLLEYNVDEQSTAANGLLLAWQQLIRFIGKVRGLVWAGDPAGTWDGEAPAELEHRVGLRLGITLFTLAAAAWLLRRLLLRRTRLVSKPPAELPSYDRLLRLLERHLHLAPAASQTPREFALAAEPVLRDCSALTAFAQLPLQLAHLLYRVRYGRLPLTDVEQQHIEQQVQDMELNLVRSR